MSVITGLWLKDGKKVAPESLDLVGERSKRYAPDGTTSWRKDSLGMMFQAFHTHERSFSDKGIASDDHGNAVALDGRIDNYAELCHELDLTPQSTPDSVLVLVGYCRWGNNLLGRLVGDWSLSLWDEGKKTLLLARDHAGTRTLYYADTPEFTMWSTFPEPLLAYTRGQQLDREYVHRYLAAAPIGDLTPYGGIKAVPAACCLLVRQAGEIQCIEHWSPLIKGKLRYKRDEDYQEQFLRLFCRAVKRRTDGVGVLAHLSGGVDSSAIVCVADIVASHEAKAHSLKTISIYDDREPDWDERPYFTAVEAQRGISGIHVHASGIDRDFESPTLFPPFPGADNARQQHEKDFVKLTAMEGCKVILAGVGGDELLGGPPDPRPELADALTSLSFIRFCRCSFQWALNKRVPFHVIATDAVRFAMRSYPRMPGSHVVPPSWLVAPGIRSQAPRRNMVVPWTVGFSPSAVGIAGDWNRLLEALPHRDLGHYARFEYRYPYLDRDLVEFLLQVPTSQLVRPGRRRVMMRAALRGIVPESILERKRKAYLRRAPLLTLRRCEPAIRLALRSSRLETLGFVDARRLLSELSAPDDVLAASAVQIMRLIEMELWCARASDTGTIESGSNAA